MRGTENYDHQELFDALESVGANLGFGASVHTTSFPGLLSQIGASVLVTTYQAGKFVILRNDAGVLNTHFRNLQKPMGLACDGGKLAVGCSVDIWEFHKSS